MKKTLIAIAFALVTSVAFVSGVMAQQSTTPGTMSVPQKSAPAKMEKFSGTVEKIDVSSKEVVVKNGKDEKTFSWGDQTKFMQGKKELSATDLKNGEHVTIRYTKEGEKFTAERIYVSMPKTAKAYHSKKSY